MNHNYICKVSFTMWCKITKGVSPACGALLTSVWSQWLHMGWFHARNKVLNIFPFSFVRFISYVKHVCQFRNTIQKESLITSSWVRKVVADVSIRKGPSMATVSNAECSVAGNRQSQQSLVVFPSKNWISVMRLTWWSVHTASYLWSYCALTVLQGNFA